MKSQSSIHPSNAVPLSITELEGKVLLPTLEHNKDVHIPKFLYCSNTQPERVLHQGTNLLVKHTRKTCHPASKNTLNLLGY